MKIVLLETTSNGERDPRTDENARYVLGDACLMLNDSIDSTVNVRPLSLMTVENLENVLEHISDITFTDVLDEYASEKHEPLTTFNGILNDYLEARNLDTTRRYAWSFIRCQEILSSFQDRFIQT